MATDIDNYELDKTKRLLEKLHEAEDDVDKVLERVLKMLYVNRASQFVGDL